MSAFQRVWLLNLFGFLDAHNHSAGVICGLSNAIPADDQIFDAIVAGEFLEPLYPSEVDPNHHQPQLRFVGSRARKASESHE
jgi:hypothetical protein